MKIDRQQIELTRKRRIQRVDRLVGWFTLFCYFFPKIGEYLNAQGRTNIDVGLMQTFSNLFWIMIFMHSIAALYLYGNPLVYLDPKGALYQTLNFALIPLLALVHFGFTLYLFGFPRFSNGSKVWHVYIGYITFLVMFISNSMIGPDGPIQPWFDYGTILMYIFIVVHVVMGTQHWAPAAKAVQTQWLPYTADKNIIVMSFHITNS